MLVALGFLEETFRALKGVERGIRLSDNIRHDLGIDSLDAVELILAVEDRYGVRLVDNPRIAQVETVGQLLDLVAELRGGQAGAA